MEVLSYEIVCLAINAHYFAIFVRYVNMLSVTLSICVLFQHCHVCHSIKSSHMTRITVEC